LRSLPAILEDAVLDAGRAVEAPVGLPAACSATLVAIYTAD